jgi:hypothetical protein
MVFVVHLLLNMLWNSVWNMLRGICPAAGCLLAAFWMLSCRFLVFGPWVRACASRNALSGWLLFAVALVLVRMLFAVGYVVEFVLEYVLGDVLEDVVGYVSSCWVAV